MNFWALTKCVSFLFYWMQKRGLCFFSSCLLPTCISWSSRKGQCQCIYKWNREIDTSIEWCYVKAAYFEPSKIIIIVMTWDDLVANLEGVFGFTFAFLLFLLFSLWCNMVEFLLCLQTGFEKVCKEWEERKFLEKVHLSIQLTLQHILI